MRKRQKIKKQNKNMATKEKKVIEISNVYLNFIIKVLSSFTVEDKVSSARRRFLRMLKPFQSDLEAEQKDLQKDYVEKDAQGALKVSNDEYMFKNSTVRKEFNKKWNALNEQSFKIDVTEANEQDIKTIATVIDTEIEKFKKAHTKANETNPTYNGVDGDFIESLQEFVDLIKI